MTNLITTIRAYTTASPQKTLHPIRLFEFTREDLQPHIVCFIADEAYARLRPLAWEAYQHNTQARQQLTCMGLPEALLDAPYTLHGPHGELEFRRSDGSLTFDTIKDIKDYAIGEMIEIGR